MKRISLSFFLLIWSATPSASMAEASSVMVSEVCDRIIPFAQENGAQVSEIDFYHCHTLLKIKAGETKSLSNSHTWKYLESRRQAYICHAHEKDQLREKDNFNIFFFNGKPSFWGASYPIVEKDILERYSLPKEEYFVTWTNIYFFPADSRFCPLLSESVAMTCGGKPVCIGLESDEYDKAQTQTESPADPDRKPWEY